MPMLQSDVYVVTTRDQRMFSCRVEPIGARRQPRWLFTSVRADGVTYIGPPWTPIEHEQQLRMLVDEWWEGKKALGQDYG